MSSGHLKNRDLRVEVPSTWGLGKHPWNRLDKTNKGEQTPRNSSKTLMSTYCLFTVVCSLSMFNSSLLNKRKGGVRVGNETSILVPGFNTSLRCTNPTMSSDLFTTRSRKAGKGREESPERLQKHF